MSFQELDKATNCKRFGVGPYILNVIIKNTIKIDADIPSKSV